LVSKTWSEEASEILAGSDIPPCETGNSDEYFPDFGSYGGRAAQAPRRGALTEARGVNDIFIESDTRMNHARIVASSS